MNETLQLTMLVATAKYSTNLPLEAIKDQILYNKELYYGQFRIMKVVPKHKGNLQTVCEYGNNIGSISLTLRYKDRYTSTYRKVNVLMFKNSARISVGVPKRVDREIHECINDDPLKDYVRYILDGIKFWTADLVKPNNDVTIVNIVANVKQKPIPKFFTFCTDVLLKNKFFDRIQLPFFHEYGAVATCHVYPIAGSNCSAKLQRTGAIQYMGFKDIDLLHVFSVMMDKVILNGNI